MSTKRQTRQLLTLQGDTGTLVGWNLRISYLIITLNCTAELGRERQGKQDYIVSNTVHCVTCCHLGLLLFPQTSTKHSHPSIWELGLFWNVYPVFQLLNGQ